MGEHLMQVAPLEGYKDWSAVYDDAPNPLLALESRVLREVLPKVRGRRILDAGCGTGRWMKSLAREGAKVWGVDFCEDMIAKAAAKQGLHNRCVIADISSLPFGNDSFDFALCSFTLTYTPNLHQSMGELSRVAPSVIVADLHPEAMRHGWKRSFRLNGQTWEVDYYPYEAAHLDAAARDAGLKLRRRLEAAFDEPEREIFRIGGKESSFAAAVKTPAILISKWTR
jgi:malonyl-CoA O-methyltransferase